MPLTAPSIEPGTRSRARGGISLGLRARGGDRGLRLASLAVLVALVLPGCAQTSRSGPTAALPDRQGAREDPSEEPAHSVPPDKFSDVRYRGGRDPVSGVAPGLDGKVDQTPLPPPKGGKAAGKTAVAGKSVPAAPAPTAKTASGKSRYDDAYRPPAKTASASAAGPPPQLSPLGEGEIIVVKPGDTVQSIAARYNVPVDALVQANNLRGRRVVPGQRLTLPD